MYSIVVRNEFLDRGHPVAFMITNDYTIGPIIQWLSFLKDKELIVNPLQITIDCSDAETNAIRRVFPGCEIQYCLFHVAQAWGRQLNLKIKTGVSAAENRIVRGEIMTQIKSILFEEDIEAFHNKIEEFFDEYSGYPDFLDYFEKNWCSEEKFQIWSRAYHPLEFSYMLTNNYIESRHNQLKSTYLFRTRNRRIDRLIYVLTHEVEYDLEQEGRRIAENSGPMTVSMRERRRVELAAENLPVDRRLEMIVDPNGNRGDSASFDAELVGVWKVDSFETDGTSYEINVHMGGIITSCSYYYFTRNRKPCKHMHCIRLSTIFSFATSFPFEHAPITSDNFDAETNNESPAINRSQYNLSSVNEMIVTLNHCRRDIQYVNDLNISEEEDTDLLRRNVRLTLDSVQAF